jgi:hypothetical protein
MIVCGVGPALTKLMNSLRSVSSRLSAVVVMASSRSARQIFE